MKIRKIYRTNQSIASLSSISAFIHRVELSSDFLYEDIQKKYEGRFAVKRISKFDKKKYKNYSLALYLKLESGLRCTLLMCPDKGYKAKTIMMFNNPTSHDIKTIVDDTNDIKEEIDPSRPGKFEWKIKSIEYTLDFMCKETKRVGDLYYLLRRYAYFPFCRSVKLSGGEFCGYCYDESYREERGNKNSVTFYSYATNPKAYYARFSKIYERGDDRDRTKIGWNYDDCNRVRFEITVRRNFLKRKNTNDLHDILNDNLFEKLFFPRSKKGSVLQFKQFEERPIGYKPTVKQKQTYIGPERKRYKPPSDDKDFNVGLCREENQNIECFQEEYCQAEKEGFNASSCSMHSPHFNGVKIMIKEAIQAFDSEWMEGISG